MPKRRRVESWPRRSFYTASWPAAAAIGPPASAQGSPPASRFFFQRAKIFADRWLLMGD